MITLNDFIFFVFAVTLVFTTSTHAQNLVTNSNTTKPGISTKHDMRPLWVVTDLKSFNMTKEASEAAKKWLFTPLEIKNDAVHFGAHVCLDPKIKESRIDRDTFKEKHLKTLKDLGIEDSSVIVIKTDCSNQALQAIYRLDDRRILMVIENDYLFLTPHINY